jgi:hypothetical protein
MRKGQSETRKGQGEMRKGQSETRKGQGEMRKGQKWAAAKGQK